jgi:hypothetical protein
MPLGTAAAESTAREASGKLFGRIFLWNATSVSFRFGHLYCVSMCIGRIGTSACIMAGASARTWGRGLCVVVWGQPRFSHPLPPPLQGKRREIAGAEYPRFNWLRRPADSPAPWLSILPLIKGKSIGAHNVRRANSLAVVRRSLDSYSFPTSAWHL